MLSFLLLLSINLVGCQQDSIRNSNKTEKSPSTENEHFFINGISLTAPKNEFPASQLHPLVKTNSNWVSLMPFGFLKDKDPNLQFNHPMQWWGEKEEGIVKMSEYVKNQQIKVMLKPQIWIYDNHTYTGHLKMQNEADWIKLEEKYTDFILFYARIAQKINAELLCIGTELDGFVTSRPDFWRSLIPKIKETYKGKLTYAANWDDFKRVPFWELIDYIGVDAYFPISDIQVPSVLDIQNGWWPHIQVLDSFSKQYQKKIIFTEIGYRSMDYCAKEPWNSGTGFTTNMIAQSNALEGFFKAMENQEWYVGGFLWKWYTDHETSGGKNNNRFTPQNKPASQIITNWFSK